MTTMIGLESPSLELSLRVVVEHSVHISVFQKYPVPVNVVEITFPEISNGRSNDDLFLSFSLRVYFLSSRGFLLALYLETRNCRFGFIVS